MPVLPKCGKNTRQGKTPTVGVGFGATKAAAKQVAEKMADAFAEAVGTAEMATFTCPGAKGCPNKVAETVVNKRFKQILSVKAMPNYYISVVRCIYDLEMFCQE